MLDLPASTVFNTTVPQGWADLPNDLLQLIIVLLRSPHEALAFAATCRHWFSAFLSCISAINLFALYPPVLLRPKLPDSNLYSEDFIDPTNTDASLCCRVPWRTVKKMDYIGYSHGNIIYGYKKRCHLFDAFSGAMTKSPRLIVDKHDYPTFGALTAPLASPDSNLLIQAGRALFQWKVGSASWSKLSQIDVLVRRFIISRSPLDQLICQVASFKGEIFAVNYRVDLFRVFLEPGFRLQELDVIWAADLFNGKPWFVVCDDMLLLVGPATNRFQAVRLDLSSGRTRLVKVERLENWAVFISADRKTQAFACKNPERWGGRSNCIYFCGINEPWGAVQLGDEVEEEDNFQTRFPGYMGGRVAHLSSIWVSPGVFARVGQ